MRTFDSMIDMIYEVLNITSIFYYNLTRRDEFKLLEIIYSNIGDFEVANKYIVKNGVIIIIE